MERKLAQILILFFIFPGLTVSAGVVLLSLRVIVLHYIYFAF